MHLMWSSKVKVEERNGWLLLLEPGPNPLLEAVEWLEADADDPEADDELPGLCTVTCRHLGFRIGTIVNRILTIKRKNCPQKPSSN